MFHIVSNPDPPPPLNPPRGKGGLVNIVQHFLYLPAEFWAAQSDWLMWQLSHLYWTSLPQTHLALLITPVLTSFTTNHLALLISPYVCNYVVNFLYRLNRKPNHIILFMCIAFWFTFCKVNANSSNWFCGLGFMRSNFARSTQTCGMRLYYIRQTLLSSLEEGLSTRLCSIQLVCNILRSRKNPQRPWVTDGWSW